MTIRDRLTGLAGNVTVPLLAKACGLLLLVIVALGLALVVQRAHNTALAAQVKEQKANVRAEHAKTQEVADIANSNHAANVTLAGQLNACSAENVRVATDGAKAVARKQAEVAKIERERASWEARYRKARGVAVCDALLSRSISEVCPNIKDF